MTLVFGSSAPKTLIGALQDNWEKYAKKAMPIPESENTSSTDRTVGELVEAARLLMVQMLRDAIEQNDLAEGYRATNGATLEWSETAVSAQAETLPAE